MDREAIGAIVIVEAGSGRPVGIVTDRDLVVRVLARGLPADARVDAVMSMGVVCIDADADIHEAVRLFATHPVRRLPVVAGTELVGMLAVDDLLVDLSGDLANVIRGVTAQVLFGHAETPLPVRP
jgi:CBS domain-containing protein